MIALHSEPGPVVSATKSRRRKVDAEGCCAPCRARARRRSAPRRQKDPEELASFIHHVVRLVRRDASAVAEPLDVLGTLVGIGAVVEAEIRATVADLRSRPEPYTWEQIGEQFGIGKTAAHKRFGGDAR